MSTNPFPRYTVIAHAGDRDFPRYAHNPTDARFLISEASRHAQGVTVEEHQVKVGYADTSDPEDLAELLAMVTDPEPAQEEAA